MKLSIITICFNAEAVIEKTIKSVVAQTFKDFEFIIIDGGSTDKTVPIINKYKENINVFVSEKDKGIYNAQNKGILRATGEYLFFLNSGDILFEPTTLGKVFENSNGEDVVYGDIVNDWRGNEESIDIGLQFRSYPERIDYRYWIQDFLCHQVTFIKKDLFDRYGLYNEKLKYAADHEFFYRVWFQPNITHKHISVIITLFEMSGVSMQLKNRKKILGEIKNAQWENFPFFVLVRYHISFFIRSFLKSIGLGKLIAAIFYIRNHSKDRISREEFWGQDHQLKVLTLSTSDYEGGAARGAFRIHRSLLGVGILSRLVVLKKITNDPSVFKVRGKKIFSWLKSIASNRMKWLRMRKRTRSYKSKNSILHSDAYLTNNDLINQIDDLNPDIVHLHWTQSGFITVEDIGLIKKPIVWTTHDMWPICGAEHYTDNDRYVKGYHVDNRPEGDTGFDLNRWVWLRKQNSFSNLKNLNFVGVSQWMSDCIKQSNLFKNHTVYTIPNGLDLEVFQNQDKKICRELFDIHFDKKVILFGALNFDTDDRKGSRFLQEALKIISRQPDADQFQVVVFGADKFKKMQDVSINQMNLGRITNDALLAKIYSSADVMIVPSKQESFGQTAAESMACGVPVVCFDTSGLKDIVDHKVNGYRAECFSSEDLAKGILWALEEGAKGKSLQDKARTKIEENFSFINISKKYKDVYRNVLNGSQNNNLPNH